MNIVSHIQHSLANIVSPIVSPIVYPHAYMLCSIHCECTIISIMSSISRSTQISIKKMINSVVFCSCHNTTHTLNWFVSPNLFWYGQAIFMVPFPTSVEDTISLCSALAKYFNFARFVLLLCSVYGILVYTPHHQDHAEVLKHTSSVVIRIVETPTKRCHRILRRTIHGRI